MIRHEAPHEPTIHIYIYIYIYGIDIVCKKTWHSCQISRKKKMSIPLGYAIIYYVIEYPRYINNFIWKDKYCLSWARQVGLWKMLLLVIIICLLTFFFFFFLSKIDLFHLGFAPSSGKSWVYCFVIWFLFLLVNKLFPFNKKE